MGTRQRSHRELEWDPAPCRPELGAGAVHVWSAVLDQDASQVANFYRTLAGDEQERAQRFYFEQDRRRFTVGRGVLRNILGRYLDLEPQQLAFSYSPKGKPSLAQELAELSPKASDLRFNLSHSGSLVLYAFTYGRDVGIDIEQWRKIEDAEHIAKRFFAPGEVRAFCALPTHLRREGFLNCWCRKEAYIKATGDGLSLPLDCFEVSLVPGEPARFLRVEGDSAAASRWSLRELHPASGYTAAVCVEGEEWELTCWHW